MYHILLFTITLTSSFSCQFWLVGFEYGYPTLPFVMNYLWGLLMMFSLWPDGRAELLTTLPIMSFFVSLSYFGVTYLSPNSLSKSPGEPHGSIVAFMADHYWWFLGLFIGALFVCFCVLIYHATKDRMQDA